MRDRQGNQVRRRELLRRAGACVLVGSGAYSATNTATARVDSDFQVEIIDINDSLIWGQTLEFEVEVTNEGDDEDTQDLRYSVRSTGAGGRTIDEGSTSVNLEGSWSTTTESFSVDTEKNPNSRRMTVQAVTDNGSDSERLTFEGTKNAEFVFHLEERPEEVVGGEDINIDVEIENLGHRTESEDYTVAVDGDVIDEESVELGWRESTDRTITIPTEKTDRGRFDIIITLPDDTLSTEVQVLQIPTYTIDDVSTIAAVPGGTLRVQSDVTNVGDVEGDATLDIEIPDIADDSETVTIESEETEEVEFEFDVDEEEIEPGEYGGRISIESEIEDEDDVEVEFTADVVEPLLSIDEVTVDSPVGLDERLEFEVNVSSRLHQEVTQELVVDGGELGNETTAVTVEADSTAGETITLGDLSEAAEGEYDVELTITGDEIVETVELLDEEGGADDGGGGGGEVVDDEGPGFGAGSAVAGGATLAYLLQRRLGTDDIHDGNKR